MVFPNDHKICLFYQERTDASFLLMHTVRNLLGNRGCSRVDIYCVDQFDGDSDMYNKWSFRPDNLFCLALYRNNPNKGGKPRLLLVKTLHERLNLSSGPAINVILREMMEVADVSEVRRVAMMVFNTLNGPFWDA